jgi:hypothetical protein
VRPSRRVRLASLAAALGLALAYSVTHTMAGEISASQGGGFGRPPAPYLNGAWVTLAASPLPVEITAVRVSASRGLALRDIVLQRGDVGTLMVSHPTRLPFHLPALSQLTISVGLRGCRQHGHLRSVTVHYRELGIPFAFTLAVGESRIDNGCAA